MSLPARERDGGRKSRRNRQNAKTNTSGWGGGLLDRNSVRKAEAVGLCQVGVVTRRFEWEWMGRAREERGGGRKGGTEERRTTSLLFRSSFRGKGSVVVCSEGRALAHCGIQQRWTAPPHFHSWVVLHGLRTDLREHKRIHEFPTRRSELERRFWPCGGTRRAW